MRRRWTSIVTERLPESKTPAIVPLTLFAALQVADGLMTIKGVHRFGPSAEANPLLAMAIAAFGPYRALAGAKAIALMLAVTLHLRAQHAVLAVLTVVYVFFAVWPWAIALSVY